MDQEKMGKFILELRKQAGMTQKELALKLEISDKTISKWECGNAIPDITYLEPLCKFLQVSVNELLSGERLSDQAYSQKAEANIMELMKENEVSKKKTRVQFVLGCVLAMTTLGIWIMLIQISAGKNIWQYYFDGIGIVLIVLMCTSGVLISGKKTKIEVLGVLQKIAIPMGVLAAVAEMIFVLAGTTSPLQLGPSMTVITLEIFYSVILYLVVTLWRYRQEK